MIGIVHEPGVVVPSYKDGMLQIVKVNKHLLFRIFSFMHIPLNLR